jgi:broad specificity phosphatase PhoE
VIAGITKVLGRMRGDSFQLVGHDELFSKRPEAARPWLWTAPSRPLGCCANILEDAEFERKHMRVFLFRHAETLWSLSGQHTGKSDIELTEAGRIHARSTAPLFGRLLDGGKLDVIYSSPRKRALDTVKLALGPEPVPIVTELLAEFDYGAYEGLTSDDIQKLSPGWTFWTGDCPGGETMVQAEERADRFIEILTTRHAGQTVCAASHGHMIRILAARMLELEGRKGGLFDIKTASIAEIIEKNGAFVVSRWNMTV